MNSAACTLAALRLEITYRNNMHLPIGMPFATRFNEINFEVSHYTAVALSMSYAGRARTSLQMRHKDPFKQSPN
jgi:hypothetical protein